MSQDRQVEGTERQGKAVSGTGSRKGRQWAMPVSESMWKASIYFH